MSPPPSKGQAYDAIVIGAGPAGSTLSTLLAMAGKRVVVFEQDTFPRFHVGESLLPATLRIFDRLGVHGEIRKQFLLKPGGKWLYDSLPIMGDFSVCDTDASFAKRPYSYMVERARFDRVLIENAVRCGVEVRYEDQVIGLLNEEGVVRGVKTRHRAGDGQEWRAPRVFDCSGQRALISNALNLRHPNRLKRMALFAHYQARARDPQLKAGWFVGQMIPNGWLWLIPLGEEHISVGLVIEVERFKEAAAAPEVFFERLAATVPLFAEGLEVGAVRTSKVHIMGNLGYSSRRLYGPGWTLVGDAAFFIDPCYSSGVHLAMTSAELAADIFLETEKTADAMSAWARYEKYLRHHETMTTKMVDMFYLASTNWFLRKLTPRISTPWMLRKFGTFIGGDFSKNGLLLVVNHWFFKLVSLILPFAGPSNLRKEPPVSATQASRKRAA